MSVTRLLSLMLVVPLAACQPAASQPTAPVEAGSPPTTSAASAPDEPEAAHCLIVVDGTVYLDAPCPVDSSDPTTVTLNLGTDAVPRVFVYLNTYEDVTEAFWNGGEGASHAQAPLGVVTLSGRCWTGDRARICRPDDPPAITNR